MEISLILLSFLILFGLNAANNFQKVGKLIPPPLTIEELPEYSEVSVLNTNSKNGTGIFQQLLDHQDPSKGTFPMRYWWNAEYWEGPGSPVVLFTPGESEANEFTGYITPYAIPGVIAREIKGAVVLVEHRYWGKSFPFQNLSTKNLQYLTLNQSISDFIHFSKTVEFPFDINGSSNAQRAPWVFTGGSYSGALAAWTLSTAPGTFWAYYASSAPVQAIEDYWQYFVPVEEGMPKNCSADVSRVITYLDSLMIHGNASEKYSIKQKFGLESLEHDDDFMRSMLENGPWLWQSNSFTSGYSQFYQFCDAIENVQAGASVTPDENGVGIEKALNGYADWARSKLIPGYCQMYGYNDPLETACMDTYNTSNLIFTDHTVNNTIDRQWTWILCNEPLSYWQNGAPQTRSTLVSRLVNSTYWQRQCPIYFPAEDNYKLGSKTVDNTNNYTRGWDLTDTKRITWTNGQYDPWKTSTMSSEFRPGGPFRGSPEQPIHIIPGGFHCSDLKISNAMANDAVKIVVDSQVKQLSSWVAEYYTLNNKRGTQRELIVELI